MTAVVLSKPDRLSIFQRGANVEKTKMIGTCAAALLMAALGEIIENQPAPTPGNHHLSQHGYELLIGLESCRLDPYKCSAARLTNGIGNTNNVIPGERITEEQAAQQLNANVMKFENIINQAVTVPIKQPVFDAMVIFSFNVGGNAFKSSTALRELNKGHIERACKWILPWNKITSYQNGKKVVRISAGLVERRRREYELCLQGVDK